MLGILVVIRSTTGRPPLQLKLALSKASLRNAPVLTKVLDHSALEQAAGGMSCGTGCLGKLRGFLGPVAVEVYVAMDRRGAPSVSMSLI
jgi:hypothetical protein